MLDQLQPWMQLYQVIGVLSPIIVFSLLFSIIVYWAFGLLLPWMGDQTGLFVGRVQHEKSMERDLERPSAEISHRDSEALLAAATGQGDSAEIQFGYASSFSYVLVASLFGVVFGMIVKLLGGFSALGSAASSNTILGAIGSVLVVAIGIAGTLFADSGKVALRRPVGAIAFLVTFLVSGFYWQFLKGAFAG